MPEADIDWITSRIEEALKTAPVDQHTADTIKEKMNGVLCERALRPGELKELAANLLAAALEAPTGEAQ